MPRLWGNRNRKTGCPVPDECLVILPRRDGKAGQPAQIQVRIKELSSLSPSLGSDHREDTRQPDRPRAGRNQADRAALPAAHPAGADRHPRPGPRAHGAHTGDQPSDRHPDHPPRRDRLCHRRIAPQHPDPESRRVSLLLPPFQGAPPDPHPPLRRRAHHGRPHRPRALASRSRLRHRRRR